VGCILPGCDADATLQRSQVVQATLGLCAILLIALAARARWIAGLLYAARRGKTLAAGAKAFYVLPMRRVTFFVVLVAFVFSCGGQWAVLQGVAWANMIREYSGMVPFSQAVEMTFSGQYPCSLCKAIAEKKQQDNAKLAILFKQQKSFLSPGLELTAPCLAASPQTFVARESFLQTRSDVPPTPPPRFA
jgi:hypothetical protein